MCHDLHPFRFLVGLGFTSCVVAYGGQELEFLSKGLLPEELSKKFDKPLTCYLPNESLVDVVSFFSNLTGISFVVDRPYLQRKIHLEQDGTEFVNGFRQTLKQVGLDATLVQNFVLISDRDRLLLEYRRRKERHVALRKTIPALLLEALMMKVDVSYDQETMEKVTKDISKVTGADIIVRTKHATKMTFAMQQVPAIAVLDMTAYLTDKNYSYERGAIRFTAVSGAVRKGRGD